MTVFAVCVCAAAFSGVPLQGGDAVVSSSAGFVDTAVEYVYSFFPSGSGAVVRRPTTEDVFAADIAMGKISDWEMGGADPLQNITQGNNLTSCTQPNVSESDRTAAQHWQAAALGGHESVASYAKFSIELMAVSAPARLLRDSHRAALQEIDHAKICSGVVSKILGTSEGDVSPPGVPAHDLSISNDKKALVGSTAREGAIGETVAAIRAAVRMSLVSEVRGRDFVLSALETILTDESSHAALAWNTITWAKTSPPWSPPKPLRHVVIDRTSPLLPFGVLTQTEETFITQAAYNEVVFPLSQSLYRRGYLVKEDFILPPHSILLQYGGQHIQRVMDIMSDAITSFSDGSRE